jgi:hypothetical protein
MSDPNINTPGFAKLRDEWAERKAQRLQLLIKIL